MLTFRILITEEKYISYQKHHKPSFFCCENVIALSSLKSWKRTKCCYSSLRSFFGTFRFLPIESYALYNSAVEIDAFLRCTGYIQASSKCGDVMACENTGGGQM